MVLLKLRAVPILLDAVALLVAVAEVELRLGVICPRCFCVPPATTQFKNIYFEEISSGSEEGSYLRRIDLVYHSTIGWRVIKKKRRRQGGLALLLRTTCNQLRV